MKLLALCMLIPFLSAQAARVELIRGEAKSKAGELRYYEQHRMTYEGNNLKKVETHYLKPDGQEFATLISEFSQRPFLPDSIFTDQRTGKSEITKIEDNKYVITTIDKKGDKQSESLSISDNMLCGQGYHNYLRAHLKTLKVGQEQEIKFVLPSRRDYYSFDLTLLKHEAGKYTFKLAITNWILKMFADSIEVDYDEDGNLLAYRGLSNIQDEKGNNMDVVISLTKVEKF